MKRYYLLFIIPFLLACYNEEVANSVKSTEGKVLNARYGDTVAETEVELLRAVPRFEATDYAWLSDTGLVAAHQTIADEHGHYQFPETKAGNYLLFVHKHLPSYGYVENSQWITVEADNKWPDVVLIKPCEFDARLESGICPICEKKDQSIPILYGFPGEEMWKKSEAGEIAIGGCEVSLCRVSWYCKRDSMNF